MKDEQLQTFAVADDVRWRELREKVGVNWYGESVLRFAAAWASAMETELAAGQTVSQCAERTACRVDEEMGGTANFVYGYAMEILSQIWKHGAALAAVYR